MAQLWKREMGKKAGFNTIIPTQVSWCLPLNFTSFVLCETAFERLIGYWFDQLPKDETHIWQPWGSSFYSLHHLNRRSHPHHHSRRCSVPLRLHFLFQSGPATPVWEWTFPATARKINMFSYEKKYTSLKAIQFKMYVPTLSKALYVWHICIPHAQQ